MAVQVMKAAEMTDPYTTHQGGLLVDPEDARAHESALSVNP
jgi:hypothetical protein